MELARAAKRYIQIFLCVFTVLLGLPLCLAVDHVIISEVYYDPVATEAGGEALVLYNPTDSSADIGGWVVMTESSATDAIVPAGTVMLPHSYYLIADNGWSTSKDNSSWPDADHEEPISMTNTDAGVALTYSNGIIVDAVGWGDPLNIDPGLYETTPAVDVSPGEALRRTDLSDTDDNSADFTTSKPDLKNSAYEEDQGGQGIAIEVNISNTAPMINTVNILGDEDPFESGIQISPTPGQIKFVPIVSEVSDPDGAGTLQTVSVAVQGLGTFNMTKVQDIDADTAQFSADIPMEFYAAASLYNVTVSASDLSLSAELSTEFEYLPMTAVSIDASSLSFTGASLGSTSEILGDLDMATSTPTVRNTGNTLLDLGVYGSDLTDGSKKIDVSNLLYSFDNDFASSLSGVVPYIVQTVSTAIPAGSMSTTGLALQLNIPVDAESGNYTGAVYLAAVGG